MRSGRLRLGIRARVVASFLVLLVLAELVSVAVFRQVGENRIDAQADRDLAVATDDLRVRVEDSTGTLGRPGGSTLGELFEQYLRARPARGDQSYLAIVDGRPFAVSAGAPVALDQLPAVPVWSALTDTLSGQLDTSAGPMRWLAVPVVSGDRRLGVLVAAQFLAAQHEALQSTVVVVGTVTVLVLLAACLLAWAAAGRALTPIRQLATTARSVSGNDDLGARIEMSSRDEVGDLAASFNSMLDRLQVAFDSQKRFLDDAGHELRTPITIVRGHLELLDEDPEVRAGELALVLDEIDRMERLVEELRLLVRSQRPDFLALSEVEICDLIEEVGAKVRALADRRWQIDAALPGTVCADRQRLTQALLNLVDNAVAVTDAGDVVEIGAEVRLGPAEQDRVVLWVRDGGPGIPEADLPTLFSRHERSVNRRPGGTGLGLPIVAAIAAAHGGDVGVSSELGTGTRVEILLPGYRP